MSDCQKARYLWEFSFGEKARDCKYWAHEQIEKARSTFSHSITGLFYFHFLTTGLFYFHFLSQPYLLKIKRLKFVSMYSMGHIIPLVDQTRQACSSHNQICSWDLYLMVRCVKQIERRWHCLDQTFFKLTELCVVMLSVWSLLIRFGWVRTFGCVGTFMEKYSISIWPTSKGLFLHICWELQCLSSFFFSFIQKIMTMSNFQIDHIFRAWSVRMIIGKLSSTLGVLVRWSLKPRWSIKPIIIVSHLNPQLGRWVGKFWVCIDSGWPCAIFFHP